MRQNIFDRSERMVVIGFKFSTSLKVSEEGRSLYKIGAYCQAFVLYLNEVHFLSYQGVLECQ
jgi:hypothetical protein